MRILALEAYYGGSHQQFLDHWRHRSRHDWCLLTLPAHQWKWRMRHSALTFSEQIRKRVQHGQQWDVLLTSDMTNLAELVGMTDAVVSQLPRVIYFHENQLTYPDRFKQERDFHFAFTNFLSALSADQVWFNSNFHRTSFLNALENLLRRMPDYQPHEQVSAIKKRSRIESPGLISPGKHRSQNGPLRILWNSRWEHDKNPEDFFAAVDNLLSNGIDVRLQVLGQSYLQIPEIFDTARHHFQKQIDHWGYVPDRQAYFKILCEADVVVSTAWHEFFGMAAVEAMMAGAYPLLPSRLAYPELLSPLGERTNDFLYDGTVNDLSRRLTRLAERKRAGRLWPRGEDEIQIAVQHFNADDRAKQCDHQLESLCESCSIKDRGS